MLSHLSSMTDVSFMCNLFVEKTKTVEIMRLYAHTKIEQKAYERNKKSNSKDKTNKCDKLVNDKKAAQIHEQITERAKKKNAENEIIFVFLTAQKAIYITIDDGRRA